MPPAVLTMVGPGETEARRLATLLRSLFRHEPLLPWLVIVDDSGGDATASLRDVIPPSCQLVRLTNGLKPAFTNLSINTTIALRYFARERPVRWVMKLDTDSLVIGPFVYRLDAFFAANPDAGQVGRGDRLCDGSPTQFGAYITLARRFLSRVQVWRSPRYGVAQAFWGVRARYRRIARAARANGLTVGEHCQGGAYAVSGEAMRRVDAAGFLDGKAIGELIGIAEDLMTSTFIAATGMAVRSFSGRGEIFGVEARSLPCAPAELAGRGYAVIHSIKGDVNSAEADVVRFFEARDTAV